MHDRKAPEIDPLEQIEQRAAELFQHCVAKGNESLARFDTNEPGKWPKSTLLYKEAQSIVNNVTEAIQSHDLVSSQEELRRLEDAVQVADQAFLEDERWNKEVEEELDREMGP